LARWNSTNSRKRDSDIEGQANIDGRRSWVDPYPRRCAKIAKTQNSNPRLKDGEMSTLVKLGSALLLSLCAAGACAQPTQPALTVAAGASTNRFTAAELLSRPDLASLQIPPGVDYDVQLTVQAVPLLDLLAALPLEGFDRLEATATDGFVAQIPLALIQAGKGGGSVAWVAVEDPAHPWAKMRGKDASAGPFYLVWQYPERSRVANEQWPYIWKNSQPCSRPKFAGRS
jgi:hypothetical protein